MHRTGLRSNNPKTKAQAVVSPVVADVENAYNDDDLATGEEGNGFGRASLRHNSNNAGSHGAAVAVKIHDEPEDAEYQLQPKSAGLPGDVGMLSRLGVAQFFGSNQEQETFANGSQVGQKYTVLGQKHQWRKNRAGRSRQLQTISPVDENSRAVRSEEGDRYSSGRGSAIPSSYESRSSQNWSTDSFNEGTTSLQSDSAGRGSDNSQGRSSESSSLGEDGQRFVVTKQKKSTYSAKLHLTGQKPLYLGRYKNEAAALAACESAYGVISTPRK